MLPLFPSGYAEEQILRRSTVSSYHHTMKSASSETTFFDQKHNFISRALECPICLDQFDGKQRMPGTLACGHSVCVQHGVDLANTCPLCRRTFQEIRPAIALCMLAETIANPSSLHDQLQPSKRPNIEKEESQEDEELSFRINRNAESEEQQGQQIESLQQEVEQWTNAYRSKEAQVLELQRKLRRANEKSNEQELVHAHDGMIIQQLTEKLGSTMIANQGLRNENEFLKERLGAAKKNEFRKINGARKNDWNTRTVVGEYVQNFVSSTRNSTQRQLGQEFALNESF